MTWDVIVTETLAEPYPLATSAAAGAATEGATDRKKLKYQSMAHTHTFPLALRFSDPSIQRVQSFEQFGRRISACTSDT